MSTNKNTDYTAENRQAILQYFHNGCKPAGTPQRYGLEVEHFVIEKESRRSVPYSGVHGVESLMHELSRYYEREYISEGHLIGLLREDCTVSLEPGAQIEVSIKAYSEPEEIMRVYHQFRKELEAILEPYGYELYCGGEAPLTHAEDVELLPKTRYQYMDAYFCEIGPFGTKMMRGTAATQLSIDYYSEEDFANKYEFIYQNLSFLESLFAAEDPVEWHVGRHEIWKQVDPARVDVAPFMQDGRMNFERYTDFIMQMPVIVKPAAELPEGRRGEKSVGSMAGDDLQEQRAGDAYDYCTKTVGELMAEELFTTEQIEHYLSMAFPMIRVKNFIEIRFADSMPPEKLHSFLILMKRMTEQLTLPTMQELVALNLPMHQQSGKEALERLAGSTASYRGKVITTRYIPKLFSVEMTERLRDAAETMASIMNKTIHEYIKNPDYRRKFNFTRQQEEMICNTPDYANLLPVARVDIFINEETGEFQFCELNTDGTSAMNEDLQLGLAFEETKLYEQLCAEYAPSGLKPVRFELFDSLAKAFLENYQTSPTHVDKPHVAVVDFLELGCSTAEFESFAESFRKCGATAEVCEIRELTYDGQGLFSPSGQEIDLIYRRAVTSDILSRENEVQPFLQAVAERKVCLMGNFCTQVVHDKTFFRIMQDAATMQFLTERECEFIREHVPYTADLTREVAEDMKLKQNPANWILKPKDSYGSHGIYAGVNMEQADWERAVDLCAREGSGYIFQRFVTPYKTMNIDFRKEEPEMLPYSNLTGLYVYNQKFAGVYSRQAAGEIISSEYDEIAVPTFYLSAQ